MYMRNVPDSNEIKMLLKIVFKPLGFSVSKHWTSAAAQEPSDFGVTIGHVPVLTIIVFQYLGPKIGLLLIESNLDSR